MSVLLKSVRADGVNYKGQKHGFGAVFECDKPMAKKLIKAGWCEKADGAVQEHLLDERPLTGEQVNEEQLTKQAAENVARAVRTVASGDERRADALKKAKKQKPLTGAQMAKNVRNAAREVQSRRIAQERKLTEAAIAAKSGKIHAGPEGLKHGRIDHEDDLAQMNVPETPPPAPDPDAKTDEELNAEMRANVKKAEDEAKRQVEENAKSAEAAGASAQPYDAAGNKPGQIASLNSTAEG